MQLKRLWDTDGKKIVFTEWPTWHQCQVWTDASGNLYIYDMAQWLAYNWTTPEGKEYDRSNWVALTDQTVWFYDTNEATDLYHWDHWDDAYYQFVDWDGTVLKSWTVIEWWTPTAPADPTRPSTEEYRYEFAWWEPAVGPITKRTTYTATYTATPIPEYTVTIQSNDTTYGTVDESELTVREWTTLSAVSNVLTVWSTDVTATAETGYEFVSWTVGWESLPATVTSNMTITATFQAEPVAPTLLNNAILDMSISVVTFFNWTGNTWWITYIGDDDPRTDNINAGWSAWLLSVLQDESETVLGSASFTEYCIDSVGYFTATAWEYLEAVYENASAANIAAAKTYIESVSGEVFTGTQPTPPTTAEITLSVSWDSETWYDGNNIALSSTELAVNTVMSVVSVTESSITVTYDNWEYSLIFTPSLWVTVTWFLVDWVSKTTWDTITITWDTTFLAQCTS